MNEKTYQNVGVEYGLYKQVKMLSVIKGIQLRETLSLLIRKGLEGETLEFDFVAKKNDTK
jgi:hypothetical protein